MIRTLKKVFIAFLVLWGVFLSSALAQVAQFITSHDDARDHIVANYIQSQPALDARVIHQIVQDCMAPPAIKSEEEGVPLPSPIKPNPYPCLQQKGHPELARRLQLSDEAMQSVSWPLSVFW